jgi:hypothetical protein
MVAEPRDLFLLATGQDTGGWNWRIREAFARHSEAFTARAMAATRTYIQYPEDLPYRQHLAEQMYSGADVIHLQNQLAGYQLYDQGAGKPTVLQHHGTIFREGHVQLSEQARRAGMTEICSTLDLTVLEPGVEWVPVPYQPAELERIRREHYRPSEAIRIAHAPTNRAVKGTEHFLEVFARLARRHRLELVLIEYRSWRQCLQMKARSDIFYDQLELGYGCNAVEAWGMGLPVVAGVADPKVRTLMVKRWGRLPFMDATPATLEYVLEQLIISEEARRETAQLGREHFDRWHDERVVTPWLEGIYSAARATVPGPMRQLSPGRPSRAALREERAQRAQRSLERALRQREALRAGRGG